jgi:hypothetical protein
VLDMGMPIDQEMHHNDTTPADDFHTSDMYPDGTSDNAPDPDPFARDVGNESTSEISSDDSEGLGLEDEIRENRVASYNEGETSSGEESPDEMDHILRLRTNQLQSEC